MYIYIYIYIYIYMMSATYYLMSATSCSTKLIVIKMPSGIC